MTDTVAVVSRYARVEAIVRRELTTVRRTWSTLALALAFIGIVVGLTLVGGGHGRGYVPTIFDLVTPMELIVPVLAIALSYRSILGDATRGELELLRSYPLTPEEHVLGVFVGRAIIVTVLIALAMGVSFVLVAVTPPETVRVFATHETADSPAFFLRFAVLTVTLGVTFTAIALAASALVSSTRGAVALVAALLLVLFVGIELAIVRGLATGMLPEGWVTTALGLNPLSAYRGLVLETAASVDPGAATRAASPLASAIGLTAWTIGSLAIAVVARRLGT